MYTERKCASVNIKGYKLTIIFLLKIATAIYDITNMFNRQTIFHYMYAKHHICYNRPSELCQTSNLFMYAKHHIYYDIPSELCKTPYRLRQSRRTMPNNTSYTIDPKSMHNNTTAMTEPQTYVLQQKPFHLCWRP